MPVPCARRLSALLLAAGLALTLAACGGAADDNPVPASAAPPPSAVPVESPARGAPAPQAETPEPPPPPAAAPILEPPAEPGPPVAPEASPPPGEPAPRAPEPTAMPGQPSTPTAEIPAPEAEPLPLLYDTYDLSGAVAEPGHYAFLADPDDPASVVTTYEGLRDGTTTALLVHKHDGYGASQAALYDAVEPGDLFEWRQAADCFVRYQVTAVKPDPTGTVLRKLLGVAWMTYAFTGCSGSIADGSGASGPAASFGWGDLPDLGGTSLTVPIRHAQWQIVPTGWTGETEDPQPRDGEYTEVPPGRKTTIAEARLLPRWRDPDLPSGWMLWAAITDPTVTPFGYEAAWGTEDGYLGIIIRGEQAGGTGFIQYATGRYAIEGNGTLSVAETRTIAGRPAIVSYSPAGPTNDIGFLIRLLLHDPATDSEYTIFTYDPSLGGSNVDAVIAIAESLFEPPRAAVAWEPLPYAEDFTGPCRPRLLRTVVRHDLLALALEPCPLPSTTLSYGAPSTTGTVTDDGDYAFLSDPDDLTTAVTTYEGLRDGSTTGLVLHQNDGAGASQAAFYALVQAGDIVEWREATDCFVRYPVTEVKDDPTGDPPRKLLAVKVMTYAFTGCSGAIDTTESPAITWSPANLQSPEMTIPIRHGPWQLMPLGWTGAREATVSVTTPGTVETGEIAEVRRHRLWREPDLPAGWRLSVATAGREGSDGVFAQYVDAEGYIALDIVISQPRRLGDALGGTTADHSRFIVEARVIDGHAAYVQYSPIDDRIYSTLVIIHDAARGIEYGVVGMEPSLRGANVEATIAIARSLYREAP